MMKIEDKEKEKRCIVSEVEKGEGRIKYKSRVRGKWIINEEGEDDR